MTLRLVGVCVVIQLVCCVVGAQTPTDQQRAAQHINEATLRAHIRFLADDLLEGRGPGTRGDLLGQRYIQSQFQANGLQPATSAGWFQSVPLVGMKTHCPDQITFKHGERQLRLKFYDEYIAAVARPTPRIRLQDAEVVFVGYGIQAPEYDWDDYKGVDLKGKLLLMMNNDPSQDPDLFEGRRRLYYGRWDYKYLMAAKQGAAGAIIIHTTPSAGYPFQVVQTSWTGEEFELADTDVARMDVRGWVTENAARQLAALSGKDLDQLRAAAEKRDFRPISLGTTLSVDLRCEVREQRTANVLGMMAGRDPELSKEFVVFMAHHDHLGMAEQRDETGDNIYNGALDNASGTSAILTILKACQQLKQRPKRSILFAAVGAEEQGLLGSKYLAEHPPVPAGYMSALINIDGLSVLGRTRDISMIGYGKSELDRYVKSVAALQNRVVLPDQFPDQGSYYRSDQFSLAKIGVPGVYLRSGVSVIGKPDGWGKAQKEEWVQNIYHQPSDEYSEDWELSGAVEDVRLLFHVGIDIANADHMPKWKPGDEFEAARKSAIANR